MINFNIKGSDLLMKSLSVLQNYLLEFKMKFLFPLLAAFLAAASAISYEDVLIQEYNLYKAQYGKSYEDPLENSRRMEIFLENKYEVAQHNLKYRNGEVTYEMEINEFSDWLPEEFDNMNGFKAEYAAEIGGELYEPPNVEAPSSVNWVEKGVVSPVKNQGSCGSCYAFSALGALESQVYMKSKKMVRLSEQQIVDCSGKFGNMGCNGGLPSKSYDYIKANGGVNSESSYPYEGRQGKCRYNKNNNAATCAGYGRVSASEDALKNAVANVGPVSVAIHSIASLSKYKGGVYYDSSCRNSPSSMNHAVLVVGYGTDSSTKQDYWIVKNSWGTGWGERGYVRMARNKNNLCGIANLAVYPKI